MDSISDIIESLKKRFTNPFVLSFILSWIVYNWQIPIGLLWYDTDQLKRAGYSSLFDMINCVAGRENSILIPLGFASIYGITSTFIFPAVRYFTGAFKAWITTKQEGWILRITKDSSIPTKKYIRLKDQYDERAKILENHIASEGETQSKLEKVTTVSMRLQGEINDLKNTAVQQQIEHDEKVASIRQGYENQIGLMVEKKGLLELKLASYSNLEPIKGIWNVWYDNHTTKLIRFVSDFKDAFTPAHSVTPVHSYFVISILTKDEITMIAASTDTDHQNKTFFSLERKDDGFIGYENEKEIKVLPFDEEIERANKF